MIPPENPKDDVVAQKMATAADLYEQGRYEEAYRAYMSLAEDGSTKCQSFVGWMSWRGVGVKQSDHEAEKWFKRAANTGDPEGQFYLGRLYEVSKKDLHFARQCFEKAASQGDLPAIYRLGRMLMNGIGGSVDTEKAITLFDKAAERGHLFAKRELSLLIMKGHRGILNIPIGFLMFLRTGVDGFKVKLRNDPCDERAFR